MIHKCSRCGLQANYSSSCPNCGALHTLKPLVQGDLFTTHSPPVPSTGREERVKMAPIIFRESPIARIKTGLDTLDECLGGGFVKSSTILLSGDWGSGKSTLALYLAGIIGNCLYVATEETREQIEDRARRTNSARMCPLLTNPDDTPIKDVSPVYSYLTKCKEARHGLTGIETVIIDSLQGFDGTSTMGGLMMVAKDLDKLCKAFRLALIVVGQFTKNGSIAGPNALSHLFDTVLVLEKTRTLARVLICEKSRYAPAPKEYLLNLSGTGWTEAPVAEETSAGDNSRTVA